MNIFSLRSKMKQTFRNLCVGQTSTSTLDQTQTPHPATATLFTFHDLHPSPTAAPPPSSFATAASTTTSSSYINKSSPRNSVTLEEMILQLELEEELARRAKLLDEHRRRQQQQQQLHNSSNNKFVQQHRMSCVNSSDILRSARNALNQYPRFSLDGKDAMYRSSFRNDDDRVHRRFGGGDGQEYRLDVRLGKMMPLTEKRRVGVGEKVVWCKPGVVAKLMGLDALPVPMSKMTSNNHKGRNRGVRRGGNCTREEKAGIRNDNLRRRVQRNEVERRKREFMMNVDGMKRRSDVCYGSSNKSPGYCVMKPLEKAAAGDGLVGWRRTNLNHPPPFF